MANARTLLAVGLLMVLGFAVFAAVYWSRSGNNNNSPGGLYEWTAELSVVDSTADTTYTMKVYSHITLDGTDATGLPIIQSWNLLAQVDYADQGTKFRHAYISGAGGQSGLAFFGKVDGQDQFNVSDCQLTDQRDLIDNGGALNPPVQIVDSRNMSGTTEYSVCPGCTRWKFTLTDFTYTILEQDGVPKFAINRDAVFKVTSFVEGPTSWAGPTVPRWADDLCPGQNRTSGPNATNATGGSPKLSAPEGAAPFEVRGGHPVAMRLRAAGFWGQGVAAPSKPAAVTPNSDWRAMATHYNEKAGRVVDLRVDQSKVTTQGYCPSNWVGDGWCDAGCNEAGYNWDGGDCCAGTCTVGRTYACGIVGYNCLRPTQRRCLFLHGVGTSGTNTFISSNPAGNCLPRCNYWGDMQGQLAGICSTFEYAYFDTNNMGWNNAGLQNSYYAKALEVYNSGGNVYAHSMANDVLGGACWQQGKCSVRFISLGGPFTGSRAANLADLGAKIFGSSAYGPAYQTLKRNVYGLADSGGLMQTAVRNNRLVKAATCGTSGWGGGGLAGAALAVIKVAAYSYCCGTVPWWLGGWCYCVSQYDADGMVGADECQGSTSNSWGGSSSAFYLASMNHNDNTGMSGNFASFYDWLRYVSRL